MLSFASMWIQGLRSQTSCSYYTPEGYCKLLLTDFFIFAIYHAAYLCTTNKHSNVIYVDLKCRCCCLKLEILFNSCLIIFPERFDVVLQFARVSLSAAKNPVKAGDSPFCEACKTFIGQVKSEVDNKDNQVMQLTAPTIS